jgi:hypothetical protein
MAFSCAEATGAQGPKVSCKCLGPASNAQSGRNTMMQQMYPLLAAVGLMAAGQLAGLF